jgi:exopolysaccharide biosynthesis WecB/TagA/CpsF family protein
VLIIGGGPETVPALTARFGITNIRQHIPPMGLIQNEAALDEAARFIVANPARFVFIAVGSPQQEIIALRARKLGATCGIALCVGASLDYLTGRSRRAPWLLQVLALEWLYRLIREPRRLWRRYLVRSPRIFSLMHKDARRRRRNRRNGLDAGDD